MRFYTDTNEIEKIICDNCGKEINKNDNYYTIKTNYSNDNNSGIITGQCCYKDICSDECLKNEVNYYINSGYNNKHINIDKGIFCK